MPKNLNPDSDMQKKSRIKKMPAKSYPSRMGAITAARKKGGLKGMPINAAGIDYQDGKWKDNTGRTFATASTEDSKPTLLKRRPMLTKYKDNGGKQVRTPIAGPRPNSSLSMAARRKLRGKS